MANRNFTQRMFTLHNAPVILDCNFKVDSADEAGFGITDLKGPGIQNVFMFTSETPAAGSPSPLAGYAIIFLQDNYSRMFSMFSEIQAPLSGSDISTGMVIGTPYTISLLGASTLAQFQAAGLPMGFAPAIGMPFIATATSIAGGAKVQIAASSDIEHVELIGSALNFQASPQPGRGPFIIVQFMADDVITAPADGTTISLSFYLSNSSIRVQGE